MIRFGVAMGGRRETLAGLSGLGDLVLTCSSTSSREFLARSGHRPGQEHRRADDGPAHGCGGRAYRAVLHRIAIERGIDMPLVGAVLDLLEGRVKIGELLETLLSRPPGEVKTNYWGPSP